MQQSVRTSSSFLTDRDQYTKLGEQRSFTHVINRSIVQGSGNGPTLFVIFICDLRPISAINRMAKYTVDATLLVPEKIYIQIQDEFNSITKWAADNKLTINLSNTRELIFHRPNPRNYIPPTEINGIEIVSVVKLLGIWLQDDMSFTKHVDYITHICNQRLYLLNQLKKQSLPRTELQSVFVITVLSRLLYASPAWNGYATASNLESLKNVLIKAKRWQIVDKDYVLQELFRDCERALFSAAQSSNHCLNHLFLVKPNRVHTISLRSRGS